VRPVIADTNPVSYITDSWLLRYVPGEGRKEIRQLEGLVDLCTHIEAGVSALDAACEPTSRVSFGEKGTTKVIFPTDPNQKLALVFRQLHKSWKRWLLICRV
jgi:hypothetical protein